MYVASDQLASRLAGRDFTLQPKDYVSRDQLGGSGVAHARDGVCDWLCWQMIGDMLGFSVLGNANAVGPAAAEQARLMRLRDRALSSVSAAVLTTTQAQLCIAQSRCACSKHRAGHSCLPTRYGSPSCCCVGALLICRVCWGPGWVQVDFFIVGDTFMKTYVCLLDCSLIVLPRTSHCGCALLRLDVQLLHCVQLRGRQHRLPEPAGALCVTWLCSHLTAWLLLLSIFTHSVFSAVGHARAHRGRRLRHLLCGGAFGKLAV